MDKILLINNFLPSIDVHAKKPFLSIPLEEAVRSGVKVPCIMGAVSHEGIIIAAGYYLCA